MDTSTGKRTARVRRTLTKRTVNALLPAEKPWVVSDDKLTGFGVRIQPSGTKAFIVNYRAGDGGRKAPIKRVALGRYGPLTADKARRLAHEVLGKVAGGDDPAEDRAEARGMPTLGGTFEQYMAANSNRSKRTNELYRYEANRYLGDWLPRPLDAVSRADVEARFNSITADHGWSTANRAMSLLCSIYRRPCVDHDWLRNPVDLWPTITSQLAAILERRRAAAADLPEGVRERVFPSPTSATGHVQDSHHLSTPASARPAGPSSGFTDCATPSSPSSSANQSCRPRSPSGWSTTPGPMISPRDTLLTGPSPSVASPLRGLPIGSSR